MTETHPDLLSSISKVEGADGDRELPAGVPPSDDSVEASSDIALEGIDPVAEPIEAKPEAVSAPDLSPSLQTEAGQASTGDSPGLIKDDSSSHASKDDLAALKRELAAQISALETHLGEKMQFHGWALLAGVALLMAIAAAVIELF